MGTIVPFDNANSDSFISLKCSDLKLVTFLHIFIGLCEPNFKTKVGIGTSVPLLLLYRNCVSMLKFFFDMLYGSDVMKRFLFLEKTKMQHFLLLDSIHLFLAKYIPFSKKYAYCSSDD